MLTQNDCVTLAERHFEQLFESLAEIAETKKPYLTVQQLFTQVIKSMDPIPKTAITFFINDYIARRFDRYFRSNSHMRENFLSNLIQELDNVHIDQLIDKVTSCTYFRNDWSLFNTDNKNIAQENACLSLDNRFIKDLRTNGVNGISICWSFNNPFWSLIFRTRDDSSMKELMEGIVPFLLRWKVRTRVSMGARVEDKGAKLEEKILADTIGHLDLDKARSSSEKFVD